MLTRLVAAATAVGFILGALIGWVSYDGDADT